LPGSSSLFEVPTVFTKDGFRFFFYSNDHRPIHVHVRKGDGEAVFDVTAAVELRESHGLKLAELRRAQTLAEEHRELILQKWHEHLG
jgi:hypothetical protein